MSKIAIFILIYVVIALWISVKLFAINVEHGACDSDDVGRMLVAMLLGAFFPITLTLIGIMFLMKKAADKRVQKHERE